MKTGSAAVLAALFLWLTPLHAQQSADPTLPEQIIDGVRGLLNRIFGGPGTPNESLAPAGQPAEAQSAQSAPSAAPPATPSARVENTSVAPTAEAQTLSRSLHEAVVNGDLAGTLKMLDQGTDIESKDPGSGASPLHYAVMKGRMEIVNLLLSRGADVNSRTRNGTTPLHTAALYARKEVAERLIEQRADINAVSSSGATPLTLSTAAKNWPIAEMLKARGAK